MWSIKVTKKVKKRANWGRGVHELKCSLPPGGDQDASAWILETSLVIPLSFTVCVLVSVWNVQGSAVKLAKLMHILHCRLFKIKLFYTKPNLTKFKKQVNTFITLCPPAPEVMPLGKLQPYLEDWPGLIWLVGRENGSGQTIHFLLIAGCWFSFSYLR